MPTTDPIPQATPSAEPEEIKMTKPQVLKTFFHEPPVSNTELIAFSKVDKNGYNELASLAADALGVTLKV